MKKKQDPKKVAYREAIKEIRDRYVQELEQNLLTCISIRDDGSKTDKARIDASVAIAKMLGGYHGEKSATKKEEEKTPRFDTTPPKLNKKLQERIKDLTPSNAVE